MVAVERSWFIEIPLYRQGVSGDVHVLQQEELPRQYRLPQLAKSLAVLEYDTCCPLLLPSWLSVFGNRVKSLRLHRHQQEPFELYEEDAVDGLVRGLATQPAQMMDTSFSKEVKNRGFFPQKQSFVHLGRINMWKVNILHPKIRHTKSRPPQRTSPCRCRESS